MKTILDFMYDEALKLTDNNVELANQLVDLSKSTVDKFRSEEKDLLTKHLISFKENIEALLKQVTDAKKHNDLCVFVENTVVDEIINTLFDHSAGLAALLN